MGFSSGILGSALRSIGARLWYRALKNLPATSESKWLGTTELLALVSLAALEPDDYSQYKHLSNMERTMNQVGRQWMSRRAEWLKASPAPEAAATVLLTLALKTLDMPTVLRRQGHTLHAATFRCPFVEQTSRAATARKLCQMMCSSNLSLFHGFAQGFPIPMQYRTSSKIGWGDAVCVKEFQIQSDPGSPWHP